MIVVFDIGNVLVRWDRRYLYRKVFDDEERMDRFLSTALGMDFVSHTDVTEDFAAAVAARAPGESLLAAIRRDYARAAERADVTLGLSSPEFAAMIESSPVLISRSREMLDQREQALGDAIAAETGVDDPQQRVAAALLAAVPRILSAEGWRRSLAGQARPEIAAFLAAEARLAFDRLEPSLGDYCVRPAP